MKQYDLVFLGDSLTYGWKREGLREWLKFKLKYKLLNMNERVNMCGGSSNHWRGILKRSNLPNTKAFFILCGANDILSGIDPIIGLFNLVAYLRTISDARIYVSTITWRTQYNDEVIAANEKIKLFPNFFDNVRIVDMYPYYVERLDYKVADQVHFNSKGYKVWSKILREEVLPHLK